MEANGIHTITLYIICNGIIYHGGQLEVADLLCHTTQHNTPTPQQLFLNPATSLFTTNRKGSRDVHTQQASCRKQKSTKACLWHRVPCNLTGHM